MKKFYFKSFKVFTNRVFFSLLLVTFLFNLSFVQSGYAQTDSLISNPDAAVGYNGNPIVFNNNLYIQYQNLTGKFQLAKYNGNIISLVANPDAGYGYWGNQIIFNNNLYFTYQNAASKFQLAKFDGNTITLIANPDTGGGYLINANSAPVIYNNNLYFRYANAAGKYQLAKFNGTSISLVNNPDAGIGIWSTANLIVYNNKICFGYKPLANIVQLGQYDGNTITLTANPDAGWGFQSTSIVYNNTLYFEYKNISNNIVLARFNGGAVTLVPNPDGGLGLYPNTPIIYNNNLYFKYANASLKFQLAMFNGANITLITNPDAGNYVDNPIIYNNNLYFQYQNANLVQQLAKYDGSMITLINNPDNMMGNAGSITFGVNGIPIIHNNILYFGYFQSPKFINYLAGFDGTTIKVIPNPDTVGYQYVGAQVIYKSHLYFELKNQIGVDLLTKLINEPCNKYIKELTNGDMQYTVTFTGKQANVQVFVSKDKVGNIVATSILGNEIDNKDGTYTYFYVHPASNYMTNDPVYVRFFSQKGVDPQMFTPGPDMNYWSDPFTYNVSTCDKMDTTTKPKPSCDYPQGFMDLKIQTTGDVLCSITLGSHQAYIEFFYQINGGATQGMGNIVGSEVVSGANYTYSFKIPAAKFINGNMINYRFYYYGPNQGGTFYPGPAEGNYSQTVIYTPCLVPGNKAFISTKLEIKQIENQVICENVNESNLMVQVYNMSGQLVYTTNTKTFSLDQFSSGIYLITAISNGELTTTKIFVK